MLPKYVNYVETNKQRSILSRFYGLYEVKMPGVNPVSLVIQSNCLQIQPKNRLVQIFDLKGSMFGRQVISFPLYEEGDFFTTQTSQDS